MNGINPKATDSSPSKIKNVLWANIDDDHLEEKPSAPGTPHPRTKKFKIAANANSTPISLYGAYDSDEDISYVPEIPNKKRKRTKKNTNWIVTDCPGLKPDKTNRPIGAKPKLKRIKKGRVVNTRNGSYIFDEDTFTSNQIAEQIFKNMIRDELESVSEGSADSADPLVSEGSTDSESPDELIPIEDDPRLNNSSPTVIFESSSDESDYNLDVIFNPPEIKLDGKKCQIIEPKVPESAENKTKNEKPVKVQTKSLEINILENLEYFISENNDTCIVILKHPFKLYFNGKLSLTLLSGKLEILGHIIDFNEEKQYEIYNPRGQSFLCLETLQSKRNPNISNILKKYLDEDVIKTITFNNNCIIALKNITNKMSDYLIKHTAQHLYPNTMQLTLTNRPLIKLENKLSCLFETETASLKLYKKHKDWMKLTNKCLIQAKEMYSRSIICGGKNVGKSTLLRYMVNNMLNEVNQVVYIDLDPGQSEFTISGCVSVFVIDSPIFGPNYTHLKPPKKSFFIGDVNVTSVLDRYITSVKELLDYCEQNVDKNIPWVVNCMGFSKSIGTDIIVLIIKMIQPSLVVQLESFKKSTNFSAHLTRDFVDNFVPSFPIEIPNNELTYSLEILESVAEDVVSGEWVSAPRLLREMCILTYFSEMLQDKTEITGAVPYGVKLSSIKLHNINYSKEHILATLNGNLVALCESNASVIATNTPLPCYGFGIVRGIDKQSDELYLLTPIQETLLDNVNLLVRGNIALPPSIFMTTGHQGLVPYIQLGTLQGTSAIPKRSFLSWKVLLNKK